jgi:hypothetical protein
MAGESGFSAIAVSRGSRKLADAGGLGVAGRANPKETESACGCGSDQKTAPGVAAGVSDAFTVQGLNVPTCVMVFSPWQIICSSHPIHPMRYTVAITTEQ